jgi:SNF2 family DNA or RNA helicase
MDFEKFKDVKFRFVILDEAQNIKNFKAQKSLAAKSLNSMIRFALTGTPIENYLSDLWSIFDFILPGYLKEYNEFKNDYEKVIMDEIDKTRGQRLIKKVTPFILRRTKKEVLKDLPEKYESIYYAKMDEEQEKIYNAYHIDIINKLKDNNDYINILQGITKLRQICADPNLILEDYHAGSTKLEMCVEIVKQYLSNNRKILIFSTFSSMLNNLMIRLNKEGINTLKLTGETKVKERLELVNLFNDSNKFNVFLISLKAGGVGLNLTSSDCVIHYDPWWNIQAENQATDRSHRIGQTKNVEVIKLICKNTIEEKIIKLQESKKELSDLILENNEIKKEGLTNKDLLELLE